MNTYSKQSSEQSSFVAVRRTLAYVLELVGVLIAGLLAAGAVALPAVMIKPASLGLALTALVLFVVFLVIEALCQRRQGQEYLVGSRAGPWAAVAAGSLVMSLFLAAVTLVERL